MLSIVPTFAYVNSEAELMLLSLELEGAYIQQEWILLRDTDGNVSVQRLLEAVDTPVIVFMFPYSSEIEDYTE
jgi:hypothetical protein